MIKNGLMPVWLKIFDLNRKVGHRNDVFRNIEDSFVIKNGEFSKNDIVLDVGSGESIVPSFVKYEYGCDVYAIDIDQNELNKQKEYSEKLGISFHLEVQDATKLSYPNNYFDKIIAISAIEHIPGTGDIIAVNEFSRVLKPGGKLLITVPFGDKYEENEKTWYYHGFERRYNLEAMNNRLISKDFSVDKVMFLSSPDIGLVHDIYKKCGNIIDLYYKGNYHDTNDEFSIALSLGWIRLTETPEHSFGALISLKKNNSNMNSKEKTNIVNKLINDLLNFLKM